MKHCCKTCKKEIPKKKKFCDHKCYSEEKRKTWSKGNNPRWKGGQLTVICGECQIKFEVKRYGRDRKQKFCSHKCYANYRSRKYVGKAHHNFKGELGGRITRPVRWRKRYARWIDFIKKRDVVCKICESKNKLQVHHVQPLSELVNEFKARHGKLDGAHDYFYRKDNGILLCQSCHLDAHRGKSEELLEPLLKQIKRQSAAEPLVH